MGASSARLLSQDKENISVGEANSDRRLSETSHKSGVEVTDEQIKIAAKHLLAGPVVAFTGAGVSAESGVPTYRDPGGLWRKFDMKKVSHINSFLKDPVACWRFELELYRLLQDVRPNAGHFALAELESMGVVSGIVTQNVEGLHTVAGSRNVIELHGNETNGLCLQCGQRCPAVEAFKRIGWLDDDCNIMENALPDISAILRKEKSPNRAKRRSKMRSSSSSSSSSTPSPPPKPIKANAPGSPRPRQAPRLRNKSRRSTSETSSSSSSGDDRLPRGLNAPPPPPGSPTCPQCGGLLKPDAVYFGENLSTKTLKRAQRLFSSCEVALIIGSTCKVAPASTLPLQLRTRGGKLVDINPQGSRLSHLASPWLKGPSAEILPRIAKVVAELRN